MSEKPPVYGVEVVRKKARFLDTLSAVLWSFFGVRRSDHHTHDMQNLNPIHVIIVGIMAAAMFVITLILIVRWVLA